MSDITVQKYQHYFAESVRLQEVVNEQAAYIEELELFIKNGVYAYEYNQSKSKTESEWFKKCLDYYNSDMNPFVSPPCCADGHGGIIWTIEGFDVYSCDIDYNNIVYKLWEQKNLNK